MKKKWLVCLLAIAAAVLCFLPAPAQATEMEHAGHCLCGSAVHKDIGDHTTADTDGLDDTKWIGITSMDEISWFRVVASGNKHFYLKDDVTLTTVSAATEAGWQSEYNNVVLCLNGHSIKLDVTSSHVYGNTIQVAKDVTLNIVDCKGTGTITHGSRANGCGVTVAAGGTLNLYGGSITGNGSTDDYYYNWDYAGSGVKNNGTFNMYGGSVTKNDSMRYAGGGVYNNGTFNLYAGAISDNVSSALGTTKGGGGVCNAAGKTFNMSGGSITCNDGSYTSAVLTFGAFKMSGGSITGNLGNFAVMAGLNEGTITLSGDAYIYGNANRDILNNSRVNSVYVKCPLGENAKIGFDPNLTLKITTSSDQAAADKDIADGKFVVVPNDEHLTVVRSGYSLYGSHRHYLCGSSDNEGCTLDTCAEAGKTVFTEWSSSTTLPTTEGKYYLSGNVTLSERPVIKENVTLCLNGYTVSIASGKAANIWVDGGKLTITDCQGTGKLKGPGKELVGVDIRNSAGALNLYGGTITDFLYGIRNTGGSCSLYGGVLTGNRVGVYNTGALAMYGGDITGNGGFCSGAGVYNSGSFTMYDGTITKNHAVRSTSGGYGGGVYNTGDFTMRGGSITGNTGYLIGGVCNDEGAMTLAGKVTITGNKDTEDGDSNLYTNKALTIADSMTGSVIGLLVDSNMADGDVLLKPDASYKKITQKDAACFDFDDKTDGCAMSLASDGSKVTLVLPHKHYLCGSTGNSGCTLDACGKTGSVTFRRWDDAAVKAMYPLYPQKNAGNCLPENGGSWYLTQNVKLDADVSVSKDLTLCLNGYTIEKTGNVSGDWRIFCVSGAALTITDCQENPGKLTYTSGVKGWGVEVFSDGIFNLYNGSLTGFTVTGSSGAGVRNHGVFNMYGGSLTGNTAPTGAGVNNEGTFNLYGGTISDNTATYSWGGGVYNAGTLVMNCDPAEKTIFNNHTASGTSAMGTEVHTPSGGSFDLRSGWISGSTPGVSAVGLASEMQLNGTIRIDGGVQLVDMCYDKLNVTDKFAPQAPIQILLNSGWKGSQYFKNYSLAQSVLNSFTTDSGKVFVLDDSNAIQLAIPVDFNAADSRPQLTAGSLTYTGKEQTGVKMPNAAAAVMYTLSDCTATDAGSYTAKASLNDGYVWKGDTEGTYSFADKEFPWSIGQKTPEAGDFNVAYPTGSDLVYDGRAKSVTAQLIDAYPDTDVQLSVLYKFIPRVYGDTDDTTTAPIDVNEYTVILQVKEGAKNFSAGSVTLDAKMILLPRPVTVRVNDVERFVDDADSTVTYTCTITGLPAGQTAENLGWQLGYLRTEDTNTVGGHEVKVVVTCASYEQNFNYDITTEPGTLTIKALQAQAAPDESLFTAAAPTSTNGSDGTITGVTAGMEYSTDGRNWISCTGSTISGPSGDYRIRYAAKLHHADGAAVTVRIPGHTHTLSGEVPNDQHRKSEASCARRAVYYQYCTVCGENDTGKTFESGSLLPHVYDTDIWKSVDSTYHAHPCKNCTAYDESSKARHEFSGIEPGCKAIGCDFSRNMHDVTLAVNYPADCSVTTLNGYPVTRIIGGVEEGTAVTVSGNELHIGDDTFTFSANNGAEYTYTFTGWTINGQPIPEGYTIAGPVTITAAFDRAVNQYTVTWNLRNGQPHITRTLNYGAALSAPADPTMAADAANSYQFKGWSTTSDGEVEAPAATVTGNVTYYAQYTATPHVYIAGAWEYDAGGHWQVCNVPGCGYATAKEAHSYADEDAVSCLICGAPRTLPALTGEAEIVLNDEELVSGTRLTVISNKLPATARQLRYQWLRDGKPIAGATGMDYTLTAADVDTEISVIVTAVGHTGELRAAATGQVGVIYTVSYDTNGGTIGSLRQDQVKSGTDYTLPVCDFITAPDKMTFDMWEIDGVSYKAGTAYRVMSDVTVVALWKDAGSDKPDPAPDPGPKPDPDPGPKPDPDPEPTPDPGPVRRGPTMVAVPTAEGRSATDYSGGIYGLTFRSTAGIASFLGVQVDGVTLDPSRYIAEGGDIEIYLKAVYLQTLQAGTHTITILSSEGNASMEFTIGGISSSPKTSDAGVLGYAAMALLGLTGSALCLRRKEDEIA